MFANNNSSNLCNGKHQNWMSTKKNTAIIEICHERIQVRSCGETALSAQHEKSVRGSPCLQHCWGVISVGGARTMEHQQWFRSPCRTISDAFICTAV
jgi:hypothetical protein